MALTASTSEEGAAPAASAARVQSGEAVQGGTLSAIEWLMQIPQRTTEEAVQYQGVGMGIGGGSCTGGVARVRRCARIMECICAPVGCGPIPQLTISVPARDPDLTILRQHHAVVTACSNSLRAPDVHG